MSVSAGLCEAMTDRRLPRALGRPRGPCASPLGTRGSKMPTLETLAAFPCGPLTYLPPLPPPTPTALLLLRPSFAGWGQAAVAPVAWAIRHDHGGC